MEMNTQPWWLAAPAPQPGEPIHLVHRNRELLVMIEDRRYRVRAVTSPVTPERLALVVFVWRDGACHVDTLDFYEQEARDTFIEDACRECGIAQDVLRHDLKSLIPWWEEHRDHMRQAELEECRRSGMTLQ